MTNEEFLSFKEKYPSTKFGVKIIFVHGSSEYGFFQDFEDI